MIQVQQTITRDHDKNGDEIVYHAQTSTDVLKVIEDEKFMYDFDKIYAYGQELKDFNITELYINGRFNLSNCTGTPMGFGGRDCTLFNKVIKNESNEVILVIQEAHRLDLSYVRYIHRGGGTMSAGDWLDSHRFLNHRMEELEDYVGKKNPLIEPNITSVVIKLRDDLKLTNDDLKALEKKLTEHNHDDRYVLKNDIFSENKQFYQGKKVDGSRIFLMGVNENNEVIMGSPSSPLRFLSNQTALTHNGAKIWDSSNDGVDSGLDADYLGGVKHTDYAGLKKVNNFEKINNFKSDVNISAGVNLSIGSNKIKTKSDGTMTISIDARTDNFKFFKNGNVEINDSSLIFKTNKTTAVKGMYFQHSPNVSDDKDGIGFVSDKYGNVYLTEYNMEEDTGWSHGKIFEVTKGSGELNFNHYPKINGHALALSIDPPMHKAKEGDVWINCEQAPYSVAVYNGKDWIGTKLTEVIKRPTKK